MKSAVTDIWRTVGGGLGMAVVLWLGGAPATAQNLYQSLADVVANHERIKAAEQDLAAARESARAALGDWYPTFDLTAIYGFEEQRKPNAIDTTLRFSEIDFKLTQLLWNFGSTNATIKLARLAFEQAQANLVATRQTLLLEAVIAHVNLTTTAKVLEFSRGSEANIKRQTELEDARVRRGSGFSTDVLQAKTQLAGAQSRRIQAEGTLIAARNRYRAVFYKEVEDLSALVRPRVPADLLPESLDDVVRASLEENPQLKSSRLAVAIQRETVRQTRADELLPEINGIAESKYKDNVQGTTDFKGEQLIKVELTYDFNLGLTAVNTLRAAKHTSKAAVRRTNETEDVIEEQARNAWQQLITAKANAQFLNNQANIAGEFLELARKERQLGRRELIDVLAGETALINASSDAVQAEAAVITAAYGLLSAMGRLELDVLKSQ
jgi:adhesin transport system outer membrane protein